MPQFKTTHRVKHSPQDMFALVADIEKYPEFVPLCVGLAVKSRSEQDDGEVVHAEMTVAYKLLRETFGSRVLLKPDQMEIVTEAVHGPFRQMRNVWKFRDWGDGQCEVEFSISYEFRTFALQLLVGGLFNRVFRKFANAFESRADEVYGVPAREV